MPKEAVDTASLAEERAMRDTQRMREVAKKKEVSSYVWREAEAGRAEKPVVEKSAKKVRFSKETSPLPSPPPSPQPFPSIAMFALGAVVGGAIGFAAAKSWDKKELRA